MLIFANRIQAKAVAVKKRKAGGIVIDRFINEVGSDSAIVNAVTSEETFYYGYRKEGARLQTPWLHVAVTLRYTVTSCSSYNKYDRLNQCRQTR